MQTSTNLTQQKLLELTCSWSHTAEEIMHGISWQTRCFRVCLFFHSYPESSHIQTIHPGFGCFIFISFLGFFLFCFFFLARKFTQPNNPSRLLGFFPVQKVHKTNQSIQANSAENLFLRRNPTVYNKKKHTHTFTSSSPFKRTKRSWSPTRQAVRASHYSGSFAVKQRKRAVLITSWIMQ